MVMTDYFGLPDPALDRRRVDTSRVGRENAYQCDICHGYTVTIDREPGSTPMYIGCRADGTERGCTGRSVSFGYPNGPRPPHIPAPAWEWVRPTVDDLRDLDLETLAHVDNGGLLLRKISGDAGRAAEGERVRLDPAGEAPDARSNDIT